MLVQVTHNLSRFEALLDAYPVQIWLKSGLRIIALHVASQTARRTDRQAQQTTIPLRHPSRLIGRGIIAVQFIAMDRYRNSMGFCLHW